VVGQEVIARAFFAEDKATCQDSRLVKSRGDGIAADYDAKGKLAGIEILDCLKRFGNKATFKKVTLEEIGLGA